MSLYSPHFLSLSPVKNSKTFFPSLLACFSSSTWYRISNRNKMCGRKEIFSKDTLRDCSYITCSNAWPMLWKLCLWRLKASATIAHVSNVIKMKSQTLKLHQGKNSLSMSNLKNHRFETNLLQYLWINPWCCSSTEKSLLLSAICFLHVDIRAWLELDFYVQLGWMFYTFFFCLRRWLYLLTFHLLPSCSCWELRRVRKKIYKFTFRLKCSFALSLIEIDKDVKIL